MKIKLPYLLVVLVAIIGFATFKLGYEQTDSEIIRPSNGIGFEDLEQINSEHFRSFKENFYFIKDETDEIYTAENGHFFITSHGYPSQYMFYIVDFMNEMYDKNISDYPNVHEELIYIHFYRDQKEFQRFIFDPRFIAFADKNLIHIPIILDEEVDEFEQMYYMTYFASIHELEHVFQYWHYGKDLKEYPEGWLLEVLASYKTYNWLDTENLNLTGQESFYITDIYSMMGNTWAYTYGYYLVDYLLDTHKSMTIIDILDEPDLEILTGKTKTLIFEEWKVFMEEKYSLKYDSEQ